MQNGVEVRECECAEAVARAISVARGAGLRLPVGVETAFSTYCSDIIAVSKSVNVTAARTPSAIAHTLILDSLTVLAALEPHVGAAAKVADVGTGAGIPGIPLALARPEWNFTLIESIGKKADFVRRVAAQMRLDNVEVVTARAEEVASGSGRETFDVSTARAVASLATLLEYCAPLVRPIGVLALPKSGLVDKEIEEADPARRIMRLEGLPLYRVPASLGLGEGRVVVLYRKIGPTPHEFPRRMGLARSRPLGGSP